MEDSGDEEIFEDARTSQSSVSTNRDGDYELCSALQTVEVGIKLFFDNKFDEARKLMEQKNTSCAYHAIGHTTLMFMGALLTFEHKDIEKAMNSIKNSIKVCDRYRQKQNVATSLGKMLGVSQGIPLTEDQLHAELIFAELNLFRATLTFVQDEDLISFIKGALKVRLCYQTYNKCHKLMNCEELKDGVHTKHFIGGVMLGCGAFNVGLSLLPPRVVALLEWIGFSSSKKEGVDQLKEGYMKPNLRSPLISLFILGYNLFGTVHLGTHDADMPYTEAVLTEMLARFPNGVYFHLFAGRLQQLKGNFEIAIDHLLKASELQTEWKQFSHICYWELMWCHAFTLNWDQSVKYAQLLRAESNWSKCIYSYLCGVFLYMEDRDKHKDEITALFKAVPTLKQRFAGKSVPMEKFVARKARKYSEQGGYLMLPAHEMIYCWNGLLMLKENREIADRHLQIINNEQTVLEGRKTNCEQSSPDRKLKAESNFHYYDDYCLLQLLKGACLRYTNQPMRAELCLTDVKENYEGITKDHYLAPAALSDLVWILIEGERFSEANELLKFTRKTYSHYSLESRLHFRMHAAQSLLNSKLNLSG